MATPSRIHFPPFSLDLVEGRLTRNGEPMRVRPKTFDVLRHLATRPGELVTKDDLLAAAWADVAVTEDVVRISIRELRRALGDDPESPRFIETVHGRGYRFLGGVRGGAPATPAGSGAIMVGRETELARLREWLAAAQGGERVVGFVAGDAGIGKTTLVDAFVAEAGLHVRPPLVLHGGCREAVGLAEPYRPLLEALQALVAGTHAARLRAVLRVHAPTWLAQLPSLLDADEAAALRQRLEGSSGERMVREFASAAAALAAETPVLIVLEDLHWSDRATLDVLSMLAHGRSPAPLLVLATYRPVDAIVTDHPLRGVRQELARKRLCREFALSALGRDAVRAYLVARFDAAAASDALVEFVHDRSDGNPFFMTAVAGHLADHAVLVQQPTGWQASATAPLHAVGIPVTLREMIERQLEALDERTLAVLETGAVVGEAFDAPAVAAALGERDAEAVEDCCDLLVRQGRLLAFVGECGWPDGVGGARYAFRHALYRDVLYDRVPPTRRRRLHQLAGERLERAYAADTAPVAAGLGFHFESSRDPARAVRYLGQAADTAQKRFADREAVAYLERALALLDGLPASEERTQQELFLRLLLSPSLTGAFGHGSPELERSSRRVRALLQDLGDTPAHLFALLALFTFELMRGNLAAATEIADRALDLGPRVAPVFVTIGNLAGGMTRCYRGEFERGRRHFEAALAGEAPEGWPVIFDPPSVALSHLADRALVYQGYPDAAVARARETLARAEALGHPFQHAAATGTIARMYVVLRDPRAALELSDRCLRLCAEHGFPEIAHRTQIIHDWARASLGETDGIVDEMRARLDTYGERAGMVAITSAHLTVAEAAALGGRFDDALHVVLVAARLVEETGERMEEAEVHRWRGELLLALRGRQAWTEARECFERALDVARGQGARWFELRAVRSRARLAQSQGRPAEGRAVLDAVLSWFAEGLERPDLVEARELLGRLR